MSETVEAPAVETPVEAVIEALVVETPVATPEAPAATEAPVEAAPAEEAPKPAKKDWRETRIAQLTARNAALLREVEAAQALAARQTPDAPTTSVPETEIERRAAALVEQREFAAKVERWNAAGSKEFKDFNDRCATVAGMGLSPAEKPEFMQAIADMDDGHRIVAHLADNPDLALNIARQPAIQMARTLEKLSTKLSAPPPVSRAPAPVAPIAGSVTPTSDLYDPKMSMEAWAAEWNKQRKARK